MFNIQLNFVCILKIINNVHMQINIIKPILGQSNQVGLIIIRQNSVLQIPYNISQCDYGRFCTFTHSETNKAFCVMLINGKILEGNLKFISIIPSQSQNTTEYILEYWMLRWIKLWGECYGWKQLENLPMLFRTKQCINQNCSKNNCSFYHNNQEKKIIQYNKYNRQFDQLSQFTVFKIVPRNRIIQNTFKVRDQSLLTCQGNGSSTASYQMLCNSSDKHSLGHNLQNSFQYDQDSNEGKQNIKQQPLLDYFNFNLRKNNSDELKDLQDLMRKKSNLLVDEKQNNDDDNEHVRIVLKMIDMDQ